VLDGRKDTITECEALLTFSFGCCRYLVRAKDHNVLIENIGKQSKKKQIQQYNVKSIQEHD
jgi:hypothetical protein